LTEFLVGDIFAPNMSILMTFVNPNTTNRTYRSGGVLGPGPVHLKTEKGGTQPAEQRPAQPGAFFL